MLFSTTSLQQESNTRNQTHNSHHTGLNTSRGTCISNQSSVVCCRWARTRRIARGIARRIGQRVRRGICRRLNMDVRAWCRGCHHICSHRLHCCISRASRQSVRKTGLAGNNGRRSRGVGWWWRAAGCGCGCDEVCAGDAGRGESARVAGIAGHDGVPDWLVEGGAGGGDVLGDGLGQANGLAGLDDVDDNYDFNTDDVDFRRCWGHIWGGTESAIPIQLSSYDSG